MEQTKEKQLLTADDIVIGAVYQDTTTKRIFVAMAKDEWSVYDAIGWGYVPQELKMLYKHKIIK